ncbi:hypothetical protein L6164_016924 [Bauhinia variegata]|uniref:Uncharacterized protein n=1 Tax=Bauhinia variegata TaxID=167791 RepID=A0ACB9N9X3_BAUVA|nr:hypothetical protein L6164_016924 [Bauhinia variegata]
MSITEEPATRVTGSKPSSKRVSRKRAPEPETAFRGVRKRSWGRYVSEIRLPGQKTRVWLGSFGSAEMAARAYDSAAFFLKGHSANLNFPDLVGLLPRPRSSSRKDIQSAAAKAAFEAVEERSNPGPTRPETDSSESDLMEWWDKIGDSVLTTSFDDVKEAPLLSPLRLDTNLGELLWNEELDSELLMASGF